LENASRKALGVEFFILELRTTEPILN
jgi:hypothetical protein